MAKVKAVAEEKGAEKFMLLPVLVLILAQMGTSGDNGALSLAATALTQDLGATTADIQLANMVYSLMAGAFMIAGGMMGTIIGWKKNFRMGALLCAAGEVVLAMSPNMAIFIWGGRTLVGFGASFMIPSVLVSSPRSITARTACLHLAASAPLLAFPPCCRCCSPLCSWPPACA